ncbi:putative leader peptide [Rhodococcoides kroppenstedtii]
MSARRGRMWRMTVVEIMLVARRHVDLARVCSCLGPIV